MPARHSSAPDAATPPAFPDVVWLPHNYTEKASYHTHVDCSAFDWAKERAAKTETPIEDYLVKHDVTDAVLLSGRRRFCRMCALEPVTLHVFARAHGLNSATVPATAAAVPSDGTRVGVRHTSESATERLLRVADALGLATVTEATTGAVMYGPMPTLAREFLHTNYRVSYPPADIELTESVITTAWTLLTSSAALGESDRWRAAHAADA